MNTFQLECFLALARNLNYARTAEQMHVSQPAITRQIQSLEDELGTQLFHRSTRSVSLTDNGRKFIPDAKSIVETSHRAVHRFAGRQADAVVDYTIGCSGMAPMSLLIPILKNFSDAHPGLHPKLIDLPLTQLVPQLDDGMVNIALGAKVERSELKNCSYHEICRTRLSCIFAAGHPVSQEPVITMGTLQKYPTILYSPIDIPTSVARQQDVALEGKTASDIYYCDTAEEAVIMTASGLGVSFLPEIFLSVFDELDSAPVVDVPEISFGVFYKSHHLTAVTRDFIARLSDSLESVGVQ